MSKMIYVKTTDTCNLNCSHCFTSGRFGGKVAWDLHATQAWIKDYMAQHPQDEAYHLELHGGEPFLVPMEKLWEFVKPFEGMANVSIGATSNLVYKMEPSQIDFIKGPMRGRIGTSWDSDIRFENDKQRDLWQKNVDYLRSENVDVKLFVSVSTGLIKMSVQDFLDLMERIGPTEVTLERLTANGNAILNTDIFPDNELQDRWYLELYKVYRRRTYSFEITSLENIEEKFRTNNMKVDTNCRNCEQNLVTISADGTLGGCPNAAAESVHATIKEDAKTYLSSEGRIADIVKELDFHPLCLSCDVFDACGGDCHRLAWQGNRCGGLKHLLRYVRDGIEPPAVGKPARRTIPIVEIK